MLFMRPAINTKASIVVRFFLSHVRNFHSFGDVIIYGEGLQYLSYARTFGHWEVRLLQPHLLWHETSGHIGNFWGFSTLTPNAERLAVELSLPVLTNLDPKRLGFEHRTFQLQSERSNPRLPRHIQKKTEM